MTSALPRDYCARVPSPHESKPIEEARTTPGPPHTPHDAARDAAMRAIVELVPHFPELPPTRPQTDHLDALDAAFAHAIHESVLRRWLTLRCVVGSRLRQPFESLDPPVQAALLAGAAQMLLLDKVPVHAAVDTSVNWAKQNANPKAGALVNAVLRGVGRLMLERVPEWSNRQDEIPLSSGEALRLAEPILPFDPAERVAAATSHRTALVRRWAERFEPRKARLWAHHGLVAAPTLINARHAKDLDEPLLIRHEDPFHRVFTGTRAQLSELLSRRQDLFVQDAAAARAVDSVMKLSPRLIVDACAGQGTKTRQLALTFPNARILATDVDEQRLITLRASVGKNVQVVRPEALDGLCAGKADLVLLDVPCSNSGVMARRLEARYRFDRAQLERLTAIQRDILALGERWCAPDGRILYSTCSLEPEENTDQVATMCANGWRIETECFCAPTGQPGEPPTRYRDGAFSAVLRRS